MDEAAAQRLRVAGREIRVTHLDKVLYPRTGTTKSDVLAHYVAVADRLLPHLQQRPLTRIRWPNGVAADHFFEKNLPSGAPAWLDRVTIGGRGYGSRSDGAEVTYPLVEDLAALVYLVNLGSLELHVPQWRVDEHGAPQRPDRMVVDLDPGPGTGLTQCAQVALLVREHIQGTGLELTPVTSGSKGMQLYAQLEGEREAAEVSAVAKSLAQHLTSSHPHLVVWQMKRELRRGKVFLDWSQNVAAKTTICPWSLRGREHPTVATPRSWGEVEDGAHGRTPLEQVDIHQVASYL
ncbi:MAG TPA: non-homologous end-joining DNA ligase [Ornithinimicrobium sp.]|uniref:non-homologous end-joining DNA ligase n=1 Tax=Ornithinimicrobium sp. TaxID=1977084 RepID=UPI002B46BD70|nr:non-homologous end-joining DNA ligase [Ornithinimicrobium sp.]HKJ11263.1 non-homologous end-joining DNA ligase [Ornithinimicrobium sp.]